MTLDVIITIEHEKKNNFLILFWRLLTEWQIIFYLDLEPKLIISLFFFKFLLSVKMEIKVALETCLG